MRRNHRVTVNGLVVNARPALPKSARHRIEAQVYHFRKTLEAGVSAEVPSLASTRGKDATVRRLHPELGIRLAEVLNQANAPDAEGVSE